MQTQQNQQDNRAPGIRRVALDTLVEICGQEPDVPAFEGRSLNVSGRGMLVESDFAPAVKTALVMRFEHEGREVVVEALVAWREKSKAGGRFGVRFTALDSKSVIVLKQLCGQEPREQDGDDDEELHGRGDSPLFAELDDSHPPQPVITTTVGAPMKLHIQGLAAPMKARVVDGKPARLRVGSQLDFLKLGRNVEVEDLSLGIKREASVHSVDVQVDAGSGIPQLIVTLRWDGSEDITPVPTVVSSSKSKRPSAEADYFGHDELTSPGKSAKRSVPPKPNSVSTRPSEDEHDDYVGDDDDDDEFNTAEALLKSRVAIWATALSRGMKSASERVADVSRGTGKMLQGLAKRAPAERPRATSKTASVRSTRRLRPEPVSTRDRGTRRSQFPNGNRPATTSQASAGVTVKRSHLLAGGAATLCVALGLYFLGAGSEPAASREPAQLASGRDVAAAGEAVRVAPAQAPLTLPAEGVNVPGARRQPLDTEQQLRADTHGMVANVPLFGPTQMATTEPAPEAEDVVAAAPQRAGMDEVSLAKDESFSDKVVAEPTEQSSQRTFQVGRMNLPVIHRLRLDAPAELLQGEKTPNGFSVLIPGRKVMETGAGIASRDERITQVSAKNTPAGARITFRFGKEIPGYKARLRNDYIEFFVNSP
jgi:hypothetical protein